jgi:four helix bundle protein
MEKPHQKLLCWQKSVDLTVLLYKLTGAFPREEIYGLTSQIRRAAVSAPANISEGAADRSRDEFKNYLRIAIGSLNELGTLLEISRRVGYLDPKDFVAAQKLLDECLALTFGLRKSLNSSAHRSPLTAHSQ